MQVHKKECKTQVLGEIGTRETRIPSPGNLKFYES